MPDFVKWLGDLYYYCQLNGARVDWVGFVENRPQLHLTLADGSPVTCEILASREAEAGAGWLSGLPAADEEKIADHLRRREHWLALRQWNLEQWPELENWELESTGGGCYAYSWNAIPCPVCRGIREGNTCCSPGPVMLLTDRDAGIDFSDVDAQGEMCILGIYASADNGDTDWLKVYTVQEGGVGAALKDAQKFLGLCEEFGYCEAVQRMPEP